MHRAAALIERAAMRRPSGRTVSAVTGLFGLGFVARGFLPPFVIDDGFWRDFLTGPPTAGAFAVAAAVLAYRAATRNALEQRRAAERAEWWARAEWAMNRALSDEATERSAGVQAAAALVPGATDAEAAIVSAVLSSFLPSPPLTRDTDLDTSRGPDRESCHDEQGDDSDPERD